MVDRKRGQATFPVAGGTARGDALRKSSLTPFLLLAGGCGIFSDYPASTEAARAAFARGDFERALERMPAPESGPDRLLYALERGAIAHTSGDFERSLAEFERALGALESLEGRPTVSGRSVTEAVGSIVLNDKALPYDGEGFEVVLVHVFLALDYLYLGRIENALVEVKRADARAREEEERYGDRYPQQNAFARYVSGAIYEALGEFDEARIDYLAVEKANPGFERVRRDLLRMAVYLGAEDDEAAIRAKWGDLPIEGDPGAGEVVGFLACGLGPVKRPIEIPIPTGHTLTKVAVPDYVRRPNPAVAVELWEGGSRLARSEPVEDVEEIAIRNLRDRIAAVSAKAVARAAAKGVAGEILVRNQDSDSSAVLVALAATLFNLVTEQADLRSWLTLPANFQVLRVELPPGTRDLTLRLIGGEGRVLNTTPLGPIEVRAGRRVYFDARSVGASLFVAVVGGRAPAAPLEPEG